MIATFSLFSCQKDDGFSSRDITYLDQAEVQKRVEENGLTITYADSSALNDAICASVASFNQDKTVCVFGGSLSCCTESLYAKYLWAYYLNWHIFTYGMGGYGFSSLQGSIQNQVDHAKPADIYILWASTNDYTNNREIGKPSDYTEADGYDQSKLTTQCGGMNYCIKKLQKISPEAKIYVFGSLPFYQHEGGYMTETELRNELGHTFYQYIEAQQKVAELHGLKFLNQFDIPVLTRESSALYYQDDAFHMTEQGYANVGVYQLYFLATETEFNK